MLGCRSPAQGALRRGIAWLRSAQRADGAVPSQVHGLLRSGQTTTGLAGWALALHGEREAAQRATSFLDGQRSEGGALGLVGAGIEYPVYATALALRLSCALGEEVGEARAWLLGQQCLGWGWRAHPGEGGFPLGGPRPPRPDTGLHVDLSMTRHAAEALAAAGIGPEHPSMAGVRRFVARCAAADRGYIYSPVQPELNKAGCTEAGCRGYGTPTADAARALAAAGDEAGARAAAAVLSELHRPDRNPGLQGRPLEAFAEAMRFYYRSTAAGVLAAHGVQGWRRPLIQALVDEQGADGSWRGSSPLQKEDCPVVATSLALIALHHARVGVASSSGGCKKATVGA